MIKKELNKLVEEMRFFNRVTAKLDSQFLVDDPAD